MESVRVSQLEAINNEFRTVVVNNIPSRSNQMEKSLQSITDYINKRKSGIIEKGQVELMKGVENVLSTTIESMKMISSGEPIQVMQGGYGIVENIMAVLDGSHGATTGALCGVLGEALTASGQKQSDAVTQLTGMVHWEFAKFQDDSNTEKLKRLNERIRAMINSLNSLNSINIESEFDVNSMGELCNDYEGFIGEILDRFEVALTKHSEQNVVKQFLTAAVTYCYAETCFQALLAACIAKHISITTLYKGSSAKFNGINRDLEGLKKLLDTHNQSAKENLEFLSDRKYMSASLFEPDIATKAGKIYHLRINLDEYNIVERFRKCLHLSNMPDYAEARAGVLQRMLKYVTLHTDKYYLPSQQNDHHYFQLINETNIPIKIISGIVGDEINSLKFTVNVDPHTEFHTPATRNGQTFSAGGYIFVYLNGIGRPDKNPNSDYAKKFGFALANNSEGRHKQHLIPVGEAELLNAAQEAWHKMAVCKPSPIYWEVPGNPPRFYVATCEFDENKPFRTYRFIIADYDPFAQAKFCTII